MYAVIFRAEINELDEGYIEIAKRLRNLAVSKPDSCINSAPFSPKTAYMQREPHVP